MTRTDIGKALRHYRKQAGLTQAEFGELTGFDPKTISRLETGDGDFQGSCRVSVSRCL